MREFKSGISYKGRLEKGVDIVEGISALIKANNIKAGIIEGIGAVSSARLGYFNQGKKVYEEKIFDENMEIVSLTGNISLKDGEPFPHLHAIFSRRDFSNIGGHLLFQTIVYAFEFVIFALDGEPLKREFDEDTGLYIWKD